LIRAEIDPYLLVIDIKMRFIQHILSI
jgi:hypothetical protein